MSGTHSDDLWLDEFARLFGFGWLAARLPGDLSPSYVYALIVVIGSTLMLDSANFVIGAGLIYQENPYFVLLPVLMLGAVYGARSLYTSYVRALEDMKIAERATDPDPLTNLIPSWLPWVLFGVGAGLQLIRSVLGVSGYNIADIIANFVVFPFVYTPILVQFFAIYLGIELLAPWRLVKSDVGIHFLDPEMVGGLRPFGELVKKAYYYIVAGLVVGALITYAPFVTSEWEVIPFASGLFTMLWIVSIGTVGFAVVMLHRFMHREKREEKRRLENELLKYIDEPWDVKEYEIPDDKRDRAEDLRQRLDRVSATREYPATFSIWSQLLLSILLPKGFQLLLANL